VTVGHQARAAAQVVDDVKAVLTIAFGLGP